MNDLNKIYQQAMNVAVRLLSRRNHTGYEIEHKLKDRGFEADLTEKVIAECERLNYINDKETARLYIQELKRKGYGTHRISISMKKKGLSEELTEDMLEQFNSESDELENARRVLENKLKSFEREKDIRKKKEKIYRFLYSRGFSKSVISEIMSQNLSMTATLKG